MPLLVLGAIVAISALVYMYITEHKSFFVRKKPPKNDPFDVITLPEDLEQMKKRAKDVRFREDSSDDE